MRLDGTQTLLDIEFLKNGLFLRDIDVQIRREKIDHLLRVIHAADDAGGLVRRIRGCFKQLRGGFAKISEKRLPFLALSRPSGIQQRYVRADKWIGRCDLAQAETAQPLNEDNQMILTLAKK